MDTLVKIQGKFRFNPATDILPGGPFGVFSHISLFSTVIIVQCWILVFIPLMTACACNSFLLGWAKKTAQVRGVFHAKVWMKLFQNFKRWMMKFHCWRTNQKNLFKQKQTNTVCWKQPKTLFNMQVKFMYWRGLKGHYLPFSLYSVIIWGRVGLERTIVGN